MLPGIKEGDLVTIKKLFAGNQDAVEKQFYKIGLVVEVIRNEVDVAYKTREPLPSDKVATKKSVVYWCRVHWFASDKIRKIMNFRRKELKYFFPVNLEKLS